MSSSHQFSWDSLRILNTESLHPAAQKAYLEAIEPFDRDLIERQLKREIGGHHIQKEWIDYPDEDPEILDLFCDPDWKNESVKPVDLAKKDYPKVQDAVG